MLYTEKLNIMGNEMPGENPLPFFKEQERSPVIPLRDNTLPEDRELLGYETAPRYLPYKKKDRYDRDKRMLSLDCAVLENEYLKAVFLMQYGGRLYSLYDKSLGRELLFKNPVIQTANLGILDAWIAGGIEWNIGQTGHTFTTCAPLFVCRMRDKERNEFIRMYEYERCRELFWQVDVHLPPGSRTLQVYTRIVNDADTEKPLYWWTNTAVTQTDRLRVFSGTDQVLYLDNRDNGYGRSSIRELPVLPGQDVSYPARFYDACEYFFQTGEEETAPWEAAVYPDYLFAETSSKRLRYRKMFCWGNRDGGRHWQDHLSQPGKGAYAEIQAGLARTQRHGGIIGPGETVEFVQCFGGLENHEDFYGDNWAKEKERLERKIRRWMPAERVQDILKEQRGYASQQPEEFLYYGSGFGALEVKRRSVMGKKPVPEGFCFPPESMGAEQEAWIGILEEGSYREPDRGGFPVSYCLEEDWLPLLNEAAKKDGAWLPLFQQSVIYLENGRYDMAGEVLLRALKLCKAAPVYRNLSYLSAVRGEQEKAMSYYEEALFICRPRDRAALLEEYIGYLYKCGENRKLLEFYYKLPQKLKEDERLLIPAVFAELKEGNGELAEKAFFREYADIRENAADLSLIWTRYHQLKMEREENRQVTASEAQRAYPVPYNLDYRMKDS